MNFQADPRKMSNRKDLKNLSKIALQKKKRLNSLENYMGARVIHTQKCQELISADNEH